MMTCLLLSLAAGTPGVLLVACQGSGSVCKGGLAAHIALNRGRDARRGEG